MAQTVLLKRSAIQNNIPTTANLALGEIALNTYDGKLFIRKDNGVASIIDLTSSANLSFTPSVNLTSTTVENAINELDANKQTTLVSGTNIKTINSNSLLGSGNITVQDTLVSGTNIKTINGNSILGSGNITVATSAGGNDTQIQYNSSGSLVGATHATIESNDLVLKESTSPTIPTSGVKLFSKKYGSTREMMAAMGPSGMDYALQPAIWRQKIGHWNPPGNATTVPGVYGFTPFTVVGTTTARTVAATNLLTRQRRLGYVSASTAGSLTSLRQASAQYTLGNGTGLGGFYIEIAFAFTDAAAVSGARAFIGLSSSTVAATNVDPSTLTNVIGLAQLSTDNTQLYIVHGGSAAQTDIALGTGFPPMLGTGATNGAPYRFSLWSPPSANGQVYYQLERLDNGTKTNGQIPGTAGTAYPAITTFLTLQAWRTNNATALAVAMDIVSVYTETDY